jgi:hypothetical protein
MEFALIYIKYCMFKELVKHGRAICLPMQYPVHPDVFFGTLFASKAARDGAVIRRKVRDVERLVGRDVFVTEITRRGYTAVENAGQFVIFCNREPVRPVTISDAEIAPENARIFRHT